ncbi:MAG TPA: ABC transporter substrate-binding protein [Candidatus Binatia bacterium]|nr:ABC transporter substrate-binding protein [Candidatus Binatia bacterium]
MNHRLLAPWQLALICCAVLIAPISTSANPYLSRPGEAPVSVYIATCATSGGFIHMYTALDQNLFSKYGVSAKHVVIRTGTNINLTALATDEIQFLYCAGDPTIPGMAAGSDGILVASPLVGLPYVIIARKEIRTIQDLKGKSIGVGSVGGLPYRLLRVFVKKFNLQDTQIRPVGGSQPERYNAIVQGVIDSGPFTPPMDARGRKDGFNLVYHLNDLGLPAIYSSLHTNAKTLRERRQTVQRVVAALADSVKFVEDNPEKAKASVAKILRVQDEDVLQSSYDAYAKKHVNRRMVVPLNAVVESIDVARDAGTKIAKKASEIVDNSFAENLEKSGYLKEIWGGKLPQ